MLDEPTAGVDAKARREFCLALPPGALPSAERSWWAGLACPPVWQLAVLYTPALALAAWRTMLAAMIPAALGMPAIDGSSISNTTCTAPTLANVTAAM